MKKILLTVMILLAVTVCVFAQNGTAVTIKNDTGYLINYIYFSPSAFDDWGDDFLGDDVLADGEEVEIILDREIDVDEFVYDLQAVDEDNDYYTIYEIDLTETPVVSITMDAYDGGDYDDYSDYDYTGYEEGYNDGYTEGYKQGYTEAFRDAYLEGFRAAQELSPSGVRNSNPFPESDDWR